MKYKIIIPFISAFISIQTLGQPNYGIYKRKGTNEKLNIKKDSTYEYSLIIGNTNLYSFGTWSTNHLSANRLFLNSYYQKNGYPLKVTEVKDTQIMGSEISVKHYFSRSKDTVLWMTLVINDTLLIEVKNEVIKVPENVKVKQLNLIFSYNNFLRPDLSPYESYTKTISTIIYNVDNLNANYFILDYPNLDVRFFNFCYFKNEKIIVSNNQVKWIRKNKIFYLENYRN